MAYKLMRDGTLNKDGDVCYCVHTDTSCVSNCAAFEERARGRVYLHCVGREIIAPMEIVPPTVPPPKEVDPMSDLIDMGAPKVVKTKKPKGAK
jgi:hypothetical protein